MPSVCGRERDEVHYLTRDRIDEQSDSCPSICCRGATFGAEFDNYRGIIRICEERVSASAFIRRTGELAVRKRRQIIEPVGDVANRRRIGDELSLRRSQGPIPVVQAPVATEQESLGLAGDEGVVAPRIFVQIADLSFFRASRETDERN